MPRSKRLVVGHLENVSAKVLADYVEIIRSMIKGHSGLYALYRGTHLHYVGLASNLMGRLKQHLRDRHENKWDRFSVYLTVHDDHMKELESLILRIASPQGNKVSGRFMESTNLHRELNRKIKDFDNERRAKLLGKRVSRRHPHKKVSLRKKKTSLKDLVTRRMILRATYKGKQYRATLRKNGTIDVNGEIYDSPSGAAVAIVGHAVSGWGFWKYRNSKGEWVRLGTLRK